MSIQVNPVSLEKTESLTVIKNEPLGSKSMNGVIESFKEEIIPDFKDIDVVWHPLCENSIKRETVPEILPEIKHLESVETLVFVKTESAPEIKTLIKIKTEDISDGNGQEEVEFQGFSALSGLQTNEQLYRLKLCQVCGKVFKAQSSLIHHMRCVHNNEEENKEIKDEDCEYTTTNIRLLKHHIKSTRRKRKKSFSYCDMCDYKTYRCEDLKRHKLNHLKPEEIQYFHCYHCSYKSKLKWHLKSHISMHFRNEHVPFHCYICDFMTRKRAEIIEHFKKHSKHHSECDETMNKYQFETRTERREIRYSCDQCYYTTNRLRNLNLHKLTHLKPAEIHYVYCYHCSHKSKHKQHLKPHILRHFINEDVPFHCYICDFVTLKRDVIIEHFKKHPEHQSKCDGTTYKHQLEKRYNCDTCNYKSHKGQMLKRHKLIHLKPEESQYFYCYNCSFKSKYKVSLKTHIFRHFRHNAT